MAERITTSYSCSCCGFLFRTLEEAEKCERSHSHIQSAEEGWTIVDFGEPYPSEVIVQFDDGHCVSYVYDEEC